MAQTTIHYTKIYASESYTHKSFLYKVSDQATNDLIYKLKLAFLGNNESIVEDYVMSIDFNDYGYINFHDTLELVYDEIVVKRNNLLSHIKTTTDDSLVTFYTNKLKYAPNDTYDHQIEFDLRGHPSIADVEDPRLGREYVDFICAGLVDGTIILSISIEPKEDREE